MGVVSLPNLDAIMQIQDPDQRFEALVNTVGILIKNLSEINGYMNSKNIFEVGGWQVTPNQIASKAGDVGMSTEATGADDVRFWAGGTDKTTAPFRVTEGGDITAEKGTITGAVIQNQFSAENKVYINSTGFHANDSSGVERITIGTTPAKGAKALITRDATGAEQGVYTYDVETVDGASRTGQYITAHGSYILLGNDGDVRIQAADGKGFRAVSGTPELNDGFGWTPIAKSGVATSSHVQGNHNHGIPDGTVLMVSGGGTVTFSASGGFTHSHTQT